MLGKTLRDLQAPRKLEVSTKLADAVIEHWREEREFKRPTMAKLSETWQEFWLYASGAHNWCPRMSALQTLFGGAEKEVIKSDLLWLFDQGHAYHDMYQQKVLPCIPDGVFQGSWQRLLPFKEPLSGSTTDLLQKEDAVFDIPESEYDIVRGWGPQPEDDGWHYVESKIRFPRERIVVKIDGVLAWTDQPHEVIEIKTEKMQARDSLNPALGGMPRPKHIVQANLGMEGTNLDHARILYVFKGADDLRTAMIEHVIERDQPMIDELKATAFDCRCAVEGAESAHSDALNKVTDETDKKQHEAYLAECWDAIPPRLEACPMKSKGRAKYCPGRNLCFPDGYRKRENAAKKAAEKAK